MLFESFILSYGKDTKIFPKKISKNKPRVIKSSAIPTPTDDERVNGIAIGRQSLMILLSNSNCYQERLRRIQMTNISWEDKKLHFQENN